MSGSDEEEVVGDLNKSFLPNVHPSVFEEGRVEAVLSSGHAKERNQGTDEAKNVLFEIDLVGTQANLKEEKDVEAIGIQAGSIASMNSEVMGHTALAKSLDVSCASSSGPIPNLNIDGGQREEEGVEASNTNKKLSSNTLLLCTAFVTFMTFAMVQLFFSFYARSQAMLGDSIALVVDSMTYLMNWGAERLKKRYDREHKNNSTLDHDNSEQAERRKARERRKMVLYLEIIPPLVSVSTLVGVTIVIMKEAIQVLAEAATQPNFAAGEEDGGPSLNIMITFSTVNLGVDFLNVFCFSRSKHWTAFRGMHHQCPCELEAMDTTTTPEVEQPSKMDLSVKPVSGECREANESTCKDNFAELAIPTRMQPGAKEKHCHHGNNANLNMCSAFTHVLADTLRSIAVIVAVVLAKLIPSISPEQADSSAAVAVSGIIVLSLVPLFRALVEKIMELVAIWAKERSEKFQQALREEDTPTGRR